LYLINFYGFTAVFPWFAMARNWVSVFAHIIFGAVAGLAYNRIERTMASGTRAGSLEGGDRVAAD
jgi:hypothetical protein